MLEFEQRGVTLLMTLHSRRPSQAAAAHGKALQEQTVREKQQI